MEISTGAILAAVAVIILFFRDAIIAMLGGSIRKTTDEAVKKDNQLAGQQDELNDAANEARRKADELGKQADNQNADEDWHKRR